MKFTLSLAYKTASSQVAPLKVSNTRQIANPTSQWTKNSFQRRKFQSLNLRTLLKAQPLPHLHVRQAATKSLFSYKLTRCFNKPDSTPVVSSLPLHRFPLYLINTIRYASLFVTTLFLSVATVIRTLTTLWSSSVPISKNPLFRNRSLLSTPLKIWSQRRLIHI